MYAAILLSPLLFEATGALKPSFLLISLLLFGAALYASRRHHDQIAVALFLSIIIIVLLSVLSVAPRALADQPFPDAQETADATRQLVNGNGYVTYVHDDKPHPPRYPPGFSLALAPFAVLSDSYPSNIQFGAKLYAALYVLAAVISAWIIKDPLAGALIAIFIGVSPFARVEASLIMSDGFAAGLTLLLVALLHHPTPKRISLIGVLAGALVTVRLPMVLNLIALLIVLPMPLRRRLLLFAAPPIAALGLYNLLTFGSPFKTGYDYWLPTLKTFGLSFAFGLPRMGDGPWVVADVLNGKLLQWVCPCPNGGPQAALANLLFYPSLLLGLFWIYTPPLLPIAGLLHCWKHHHELTVRFTLWLTLLSLCLFAFYFYQAARFMAAPATLLGIFACVSLAGWIERRTNLTGVRCQTVV